MYVIYGSTATAIANLISMNNTEFTGKSHFQLPSSLILLPYQKKITHVMYYNRGDLRRQKTENQVFISLHLQANQFRKSFTTLVVSLSR